MNAVITALAGLWLAWLGYQVGHKAGVHEGRRQARRRRWTYLDERATRALELEAIEP